MDCETIKLSGKIAGLLLVCFMMLGIFPDIAAARDFGENFPVGGEAGSGVNYNNRDDNNGGSDRPYGSVSCDGCWTNWLPPPVIDDTSDWADWFPPPAVEEDPGRAADPVLPPTYDSSDSNDEDDYFDVESEYSDDENEYSNVESEYSDDENEYPNNENESEYLNAENEYLNDENDYPAPTYPNDYIPVNDSTYNNASINNDNDNDGDYTQSSTAWVSSGFIRGADRILLTGDTNEPTEPEAPSTPQSTPVINEPNQPNNTIQLLPVITLPPILMPENTLVTLPEPDVPPGHNPGAAEDDGIRIFDLDITPEAFTHIGVTPDEEIICTAMADVADIPLAELTDHLVNIYTGDTGAANRNMSLPLFSLFLVPIPAATVIIYRRRGQKK